MEFIRRKYLGAQRFDVFDSGSRPEYDQVVQTLVAHVFHLSVRCLAGSSLFDRYWRCLPLYPTPAGALVAVLWAATMDTKKLREVMERAEARNLLPGVVNVHRSTQELLDRILEGKPVPDLDQSAIPVIVSAFDVTRLRTKVFLSGKAAEALAASMAVPILFKPVWANGRPLIDGAVGDVAGVHGLGRSERVLYHHATYLPVRLTQHLGEFSDLVALKIQGLPYLNPWQLPGRGMRAFRLAREATLRALDFPMAGPGVVTPPAPTSVDGGGGGGGSSLSPKAGKEGVRVVKVHAHTTARRGVGGEECVRSRL